MSLKSHLTWLSLSIFVLFLSTASLEAHHAPGDDTQREDKKKSEYLTDLIRKGVPLSRLPGLFEPGVERQVGKTTPNFNTTNLHYPFWLRIPSLEELAPHWIKEFPEISEHPALEAYVLGSDQLIKISNTEDYWKSYIPSRLTQLLKESLKLTSSFLDLWDLSDLSEDGQNLLLDFPSTFSKTQQALKTQKREILTYSLFSSLRWTYFSSQPHTELIESLAELLLSSDLAVDVFFRSLSYWGVNGSLIDEDAGHWLRKLQQSDLEVFVKAYEKRKSQNMKPPQSPKLEALFSQAQSLKNEKSENRRNRFNFHLPERISECKDALFLETMF